MVSPKHTSVKLKGQFLVKKYKLLISKYHPYPFFFSPRTNNSGLNPRVYSGLSSIHLGTAVFPSGEEPAPPLHQISARTRVQQINGVSWHWRLNGLFAFSSSDIIKHQEPCRSAGSSAADKGAAQGGPPANRPAERPGCPGMGAPGCPSPGALPLGEGRVSPRGGEEGSWALEGGKWPFWCAKGARPHSHGPAGAGEGGKEQLQGTGGGRGRAVMAGISHSAFSIHCKDLIPEINSTKSTFIKQSLSSKLQTRWNGPTDSPFPCPLPGLEIGWVVLLNTRRSPA